MMVSVIALLELPNNVPTRKADLRNPPATISDDDLERYVFGRVQEPELATLEEHILACAACAEQAQECFAWVEAIRAAAVRAERV
jgi:hypothetical protein